MKSLTKILSVSLCAAALAATVPAFSGVPGHPVEDSELEKAMDGMNRAMRGLRRVIEDPAKKTEAHALVLELEAHIMKAKTLVPPAAARLEGKERESFVLEFHKSLIALLGKALELEVAVLEGRTTDAGKLWKELLEMRDMGHKRFKQGKGQ